MTTAFALDDTWTSAALAGHGRALRVRLRPPSATWFKSAPTRVDITWRASWRDRLFHGGPSLATDARMIAFERTLANAVEATGDARLQIVDTGEGVRTWSFYARNPAALTDLVEAAVNARICPPLNVTMEEDPEWSADRVAREALVVPNTVSAPSARPAPARVPVLTDTAGQLTTM